MATYDIDLLRALFVDKLNDNSIFLASFYEQLQDDQQISRYVDTIKELLALQNREQTESSYKAMGIIAQSGSAEIINIKSSYISPLEYQARFDIQLNDRDYVLDKLKTLIDDLRGRKFDLIQLTNNTIYIPVMPTISPSTGLIALQNNILISPISTATPNDGGIKTAIINDILAKYSIIVGTTYTIRQINNPSGNPSQLLQRTFVRSDLGFAYQLFAGTFTYGGLPPAGSNGQYWYNTLTEELNIKVSGSFEVVSSTSGTTTPAFGGSAGLRFVNTDTQELFISANTTTFSNTLSDSTVIGTIDQRYKISLSFNGIQSQEPYINNGVDRVFIFFSGSATIVESKVSLGNDIVLNTIQVGNDEGTIFTVEPTEIPASLSVSDDTFQTYSNGYRTTDRNLAIGNKMAYSFIYDNTISLFNDLYTYARFGTNAGTYAQQEFTIKEYRYAFGVLTTNTFYAKLGDVATTNTNGDVITISVNFKVGDY